MAVIKQLELADYVLQKRMTSGHGGPRKGAGAKRVGRGQVPHRQRTKFQKLTPAHVTLRVVKGLSNLRRRSLVMEVRKTFAQGCERGDFRLVEYSIQHNHLHMIVEAESQDALSRGMKSIAARFALAVNRVFKRTGKVIAGRYHVQLLTSPQQVRNALRYVLLNIRKHFKQRNGHAPPVKIDEASSGSQFDGWRASSKSLRVKASTQEEVGVAKAASWLLSKGWRRRGLIDLSAIPG
ncbi:MAG: transposase [Myxococcales bacterium]|nr:transposase [Myxococcales bacterium]